MTDRIDPKRWDWWRDWHSGVQLIEPSLTDVNELFEECAEARSGEAEAKHQAEALDRTVANLREEVAGLQSSLECMKAAHDHFYGQTQHYREALIETEEALAAAVHRVENYEGRTGRLVAFFDSDGKETG